MGLFYCYSKLLYCYCTWGEADGHQMILLCQWYGQFDSPSWRSWTWPVTTGACKEESSKCYHHSLISLDLPEINIKLNIHLYIIIYMRIFMKNPIFDDQKSPLVSSNCCLNPHQNFMVKSMVNFQRQVASLRRSPRSSALPRSCWPATSWRRMLGCDIGHAWPGRAWLVDRKGGRNIKQQNYWLIRLSQ